VEEARVDGEEVRVLQGDTFIVSDRRGDVDPALLGPSGLFYRDMRHLSRWQLRFNGRDLHAMSNATLEYDEAVFFLIESSGTLYRTPTVSVIRHRQVAVGMCESITVQNHGSQAAQLEISMLFGADFADLFEVKDNLSKTGRYHRGRRDNGVTLGYRRDDYCRETYVSAEGAFFTDESLTFRLELAPGQEWTGEIEITIGVAEGRPLPRRAHSPDMPISLQEWLDQAPRLESEWTNLRQIYHRSLVDLAALRFYPDSMPGASLPAAGLPWFMALFGRDSLLSSYQALPFAPELARTTLWSLAAKQAERFDDFRDAEPGKILHELRHGELTFFGDHPQSPYYGAADTTPLFLILLDEYERWTGDTGTVVRLEQTARAALHWLEAYGDLDGDGYLEYRTRSPRHGLANHCWKDSPDAVVHPDGAPVSLPRATCELQGYAYDARVRCARLARDVWSDPDLADRLQRDAERLRRRFDSDFWLADDGYYAFALDGDKQPVATLTSNIGHLLWSGIVPPDRVDQIAAHLCGERMFSGWGVRTLADGQLAYNPVGYHTGAVWPHDTAIAAAGLARYGRRQEAKRLAVAVLEAASHLGYQLPEALAGYPRAATLVPVLHPHTCLPQAWSAGAPLLLLRILLGMDPRGEELTAAPDLPGWLGTVALHGLPGRWGRAEIIADAATTSPLRLSL
jgi:glycogen debranching enzyme